MFRHAAIAAALVASFAVAPAALAQPQTVGYVDTAKILQTYAGARSAQAEMQKELMEYQKAFAERQKKIAEAQKAGKSSAELQKLTEQYERELAPLKQKAASLEQRLSADVKTKVEGKIAAIAKRRGLTLVLDKAAVLYGGVDLTQDVVNSLK